MMSFSEQYDFVLVDRVWVFSREMKVLDEILERGIRIECATYLWDCTSQMCRRKLSSKPFVLQQFNLAQEKCATQKIRETIKSNKQYKVTKPDKLFFEGLPGKKNSVSSAELFPVRTRYIEA